MQNRGFSLIIGKIIAALFSVLAVFMALFPFLWMILFSFKARREIYAIPLKILPASWDIANYQNVFGNATYPLLNAMGTTFLVAASAVILALLLNMMAAYAFARLEFHLKKVFWVICISTMFIPGIAILITSFLVVNQLGMLNTVWVLILPGLVSGYSIFFFRQFFLNMPNSIEEAALIDGCSRFGIFWVIFLPQSVSPMVVLGSGTFIGYWNSFIWPSMTVSSPRLMQVMQVVRSYSSFYSSNYGSVLAAACIIVLPPILLFFIFQKRIVAGVVLSGLK
jgi:multiple sugar transport system permease protein